MNIRLQIALSPRITHLIYQMAALNVGSRINLEVPIFIKADAPIAIDQNGSKPFSDGTREEMIFLIILEGEIKHS